MRSEAVPASVVLKSLYCDPPTNFQLGFFPYSCLKKVGAPSPQQELHFYILLFTNISMLILATHYDSVLQS